MKSHASILVGTFSLLALLSSFSACTDSSLGGATGGSAPVGGLPGSGGVTASGGATATGGTTTVTGGASATGGATASGGATATGGAANGGATATGGVGTGGLSGSGGATASGGASTGGAGGASGGASSGGGSSTAGSTGTAFNFAAVKDLVNNRCMGSGCHGGETEPFLGDPTKLYMTLTSFKSKKCGDRVLVKPGSPQDSSLYLVQDGKCEKVPQMPLGCVDLCTPSDEMAGLKQWITNGAPQN